MTGHRNRELPIMLVHVLLPPLDPTRSMYYLIIFCEFRITSTRKEGFPFLEIAIKL
jgi:hypothetical protein